MNIHVPFTKTEVYCYILPLSYPLSISLYRYVCVCVAFPPDLFANLLQKSWHYTFEYFSIHHKEILLYNHNTIILLREFNIDTV